MVAKACLRLASSTPPGGRIIGHAAGGKLAKQFGFQPGETEPGQPMWAGEADHLPIVRVRSNKSTLL